MNAVLITEIAKAAGVDGLLVAALVRVESGGDQWAWNPEPRYRYVWDVKANKPFAVDGAAAASAFPPAGFPSLTGDPDQEWWGQRASWGLMEIMGAVAREQGYREPYLTRLCDPTDNLRIGCAHLKSLLEWAHGGEEQALAAYNGGRLGNVVRPFRNAAYAKKVLDARGA